MAAPAQRLAARVAALPRLALRATPSRPRARTFSLQPHGGTAAFGPKLAQRGVRAFSSALQTVSAGSTDTYASSPQVAPALEYPIAAQPEPLPPPQPQPQPRSSRPDDPWDPRAVEGVTVVRTREEAERVLAQLCTLTAETGRYHAIDTETHGVDVKKVGPVGNGEVICLSIFAGEDLDFGNGPCIWVDNWSRPEPANGAVDGSADGEAACRGEKTNLLQLFRPYLADERIRKVVHNLSFDKHMLANEGLELKGFAADTMHMARLWDSSLSKQNAAIAAAAAARAAAEAAESALPAAPRLIAADDPTAAAAAADDADEDAAAAAGYSLAALTSALLPRLAKRPMKELFGERKAKLDGSPGKVLTLADPLTLQISPKSRAAFIAYSAHDARATWHLREELERRLRGMAWGKHGKQAAGMRKSMAEYYHELMRPFGELLADIEATGFKVDTARLPAVQAEAEKALAEAEATFRHWAGRQCAHARYMNTGSSAQLSQLLFAPPSPPAAGRAGALNMADSLLPVAVLKALSAWAPKSVLAAAFGPELAEQLSAPAAKADEAAPAACASAPLATAAAAAEDQPPIAAAAAAPAPARGVGRPAAARPAARSRRPVAATLSPVRRFKVEVDAPMRAAMEEELAAAHAQLQHAAAQLGEPLPTAARLKAALSKAQKALARRKHTEICLSGLGVPAPKLTKGGSPSTSAAALAELVSSGVVRQHIERARGQAEAEEAERALGALSEVSALETMLSAFIRPLQQLPDKAGRVHSSLNLNTETGRLSSQRPNLQNQPALDKDRFFIRDLFTCEPGNALIVADYEQLELRLLAHITGCKSMLEAFRLGGDFHSRTAMGMYPEIAAKVARGELLIERETDAEGKPLPGTEGLPLIKDAHAMERKKAKVLNFSIAYGKTAQGLAADWKVPLEEAKETLERWYRDRPEVRAWQQETIEFAKRSRFVKTDTGRYRRLPGIAAASAAERSHNQRAAINTPVQGTAADVVMFAMLKVHRHPRLRELGWKMVLQVHDELILEGPEESASEALALVKECMEHPLYDRDFLVELKVDAKTDKTWYKAK